MNWGFKILLSYLVFVGIILVMVYLTMQQKVDLVAKDYYEQELAFQHKIDASRNNVNAGIKWKIEVANNSVVIIFPDTAIARQIKGSILFFRASDSDSDVKEDLILDAAGMLRIAKSRFITGAYVIKLDWSMKGKNYFEERDFYLN